MSNKEKAKAIIDAIPDYKIQYVLMFLQGFQLDDEIEDDLFCERMIQDYINDDSPDKNESIPIEELAKELGVEL